MEMDGERHGDEQRVAQARRAIALIDLTDLADDHAPDGIADLCLRAREYGTAAVCVWPEFVAQCADALAGSEVQIATVVNFPGGDQPIVDVVAEAQRALAEGADEIDLVLPYGSLLGGDAAAAAEMVSSVAAAVAAPTTSGLLKVILESGALGDAPTVRAAAQLAVENGAGFVKTSTGKIAEGASLEAAAAMLDVIADAGRSGRSVGIKPSGGIRTFDDAMEYIDLADEVMGDGWATPATFRFGASGLLDALLAEIAGNAPPPSSSTY